MASRTERTRVERIEGWRDGLEELHARIAPRSARPEVRARAGRCLFGLLGPVERNNGWQMAEHLREDTRWHIQRLLKTPPVGTPEGYATRLARLRRGGALRGDPAATLLIDERGFLKKSEKSVGVARQYTGTTGKVSELPGGGVPGLCGA